MKWYGIKVVFHKSSRVLLLTRKWVKMLFLWAFIYFYKQHFFSTYPQCCLTSSWIELQTLLRCCLINIDIIIPRHFLYLLYLCLRLDVGLLCLIYVIYFHFHLHFCRHASSFACFLEYALLFLDDNVDEECE